MRPIVFRLAVTAVLALAGAAIAEERPAPLGPLPPEARSLQLTPQARTGERPGVALTPGDKAALVQDIASLKAAVTRVEQSLSEGAAPPVPPTAPRPPAPGLAGDGAQGSSASVRWGAKLIAKRSGPEADLLLTASLERESAEAIVREIGLLVGIAWEESPVTGLNHQVSLRIKDVPWRDALDHLLGQLGLGWREEGRGPGRRLVVVENGLSGGNEDAQAAAARALAGAAADSDSPVAAEAMYLLADRELKNHRPVEAMRKFNALAETMNRAKDREVRRWVQRSIRAVGDCMAEMGQWLDARSVWRNYITRADIDDPDLPRVYLQAAEAGRRHGLEKKDPVAFDEAMEDLHTMLEKFGDNKALPEVPQARLMIGGLLYDAGRWQEAETQLSLFAGAAGGRTADQVAFWLARCAFEQGRFDVALERFIALVRRYKAGKTDERAPVDIYEQASFHVGLCHIRRSAPRYVDALFAFQRAQADFPKSRLSPELIIHIARCYAEIEREDAAVDSLWSLLRGDGAASPEVAQQQIDTLMGNVLGRLSDYPGNIRSRVMFYIAQAGHRRAERERNDRVNLAAQAVGYYERVLSEDPSSELKDAARIGLARACFLAGNDERGVFELGRLLQEPTLGERDHAYAARLLGDFYRQKGQLREAVKAFRGEVP